MKTLILYASKHGATKTIAQMLAKNLPGAEIADIDRDSLPNWESYDNIALGAPLYAGLIPKSMKAFAAQNEAALQKKNLAIFLSGLSSDPAQGYFAEINFPQSLLSTAQIKRMLGGAFDPAKVGFFERLIMRLVKKLTQAENTIREEDIQAFAREWLGENHE